MKTTEGIGIEYDEDVVCDICRSVRRFHSSLWNHWLGDRKYIWHIKIPVPVVHKGIFLDHLFLQLRYLSYDASSGGLEWRLLERLFAVFYMSYVHTMICTHMRGVPKFVCFLRLDFTCCIFFFALRTGAKYCGEYVCLPVRSHNLKTTQPNFTKFFYACCPWLWLDPRLAGLRYIGGIFLLRQSDLTDLARRVCRYFIRPSVSFLVF